MDESHITRIAKLGSPRYRELVARTTHGVLESPGHADPKVRWAVAHHRMDDVPLPLRPVLSSPLPSDEQVLAAIESRLAEAPAEEVLVPR